MMHRHWTGSLALGLLLLSGCRRHAERKPELSAIQALGKAIFFDRTLSEPAGQACADCHAPDHGFANPDDRLPVSRGVLPDRFGNRNDLTAAYAGFAPALHYDAQQKAWVGGLFWDGRAANLVEQAKGPFLNPLEMANPDAAAVVAKLRRAPYAPQFKAVFGAQALDAVDAGYHHAAEALAMYQLSPEVSPFSSKFDAFRKGKAQLTPQEILGLTVFANPKKGNCAACHPHISKDGNPPLFTTFTYENVGAPRNGENPFYGLAAPFNPAGPAWVDPGLEAVVKQPSERGKFRVPTLRNVAKTAPYLHNGVFRTLHQVVAFYNTRDIHPWPSPETAVTVNRTHMGNLRLSQTEMDALVAFLQTLNDGYPNAR